MDPTARILALAPLLYLAHSADALDVRLARTETGAIEAALYDCGIDSPLAYATADNGAAAIDALAAALVVATYARSDALLRAAGIDPPPPVPSRDELAARLAEAERELADVCRDRDAARRRLTAMHDALASRVDHEPPQRAAGVGAGVADLIDAEVRHMDFVAGCTESPAIGGAVAELAARLRRVAADARQRAGGGEGRGERVERREQGAADVGGVAERIVAAEGVVGSYCGAPTIDGELAGFRAAHAVGCVARAHEGRRARIVVEVLRGEGGGRCPVMYLVPDAPAVAPVRERIARLRRLLDAVDAQLPAALSERTGTALARALDAAAACIADATREGM